MKSRFTSKKDLTDLMQANARPFERLAEESAIPSRAAGVYTIWKGRELIYVGMSGKNLAARLGSHARGNRSGDQFCVYVSDRYVLPAICSTIDQRDKKTITQTIDRMTRQFIRQNLSFAFTVVKDGETALALERELKQGALGVKPLLNPD
jgi:predicted GIY-YIG superfamily endonuclease